MRQKIVIVVVNQTVKLVLTAKRLVVAMKIIDPFNKQVGFLFGINYDPYSYTTTLPPIIVYYILELPALLGPILETS